MATRRLGYYRTWLLIGFTCSLMSSFIILSSEVTEFLAGEDELIGTIDKSILRFAIESRKPFFNSLAIDVTALGSGVFIAALVLVICILCLFTSRKKDAVQLFLSTISSSLLTYLLKFYFERSRPDLFNRLIDIGGFSYPSGHSLSSSATYFTIAILIAKSVKINWQKTVIWCFFSMLILAIGTSRIYLGVHFFSDVLAGILLGLSLASILELAMRLYNPKV